MKCPVCAKKDLISKVFPEGGSVTAAYYKPYYDEKGEYHSHDGNIRSQHYTCSYGHAWTVTKTGTCPSCDFGKDSEKTIITRETEDQNIRLI